MDRRPRSFRQRLLLAASGLTVVALLALFCVRGNRRANEPTPGWEGRSAAVTPPRVPLLQGRPVPRRAPPDPDEKPSEPEPLTPVGALPSPEPGQDDVLPIELTIRVVDEEERPVAGVLIEARWEEIQAPGSDVTEVDSGVTELGYTDAEGHLERTVGLRAPGYHIRLVLEATTATHTGHVEAWLPFGRDVTLVVRPRLIVAGVVVDGLGRPVRGARIVLVAVSNVTPRPHLEDGDPLKRVLSADAAGAFSLSVTDPGPYLLCCEPSDRGLAPPEPLFVHAPATDQRLVCRPGATLRGQVKNPGEHGVVILRWVLGDPRAPNYRLMAETNTLQTEDGRFEFPQALPTRAGSLHAYVTSGRRCALLPEVTPGEGDVEVRLGASHSLRGRILDYDPASGPPVRVHVRWTGPIWSSEVDEKGRFLLGWLPQGRYALGWARGGRSGPIRGAQDVDPEAGPITLRMSDLEEDGPDLPPPRGGRPR